MIPTRREITLIQREITRLLREIIRALAKLPRLVKLLIGLALIVEFIVVTHWEYLTYRQPSAPVAQKVAIAAPPREVAGLPAANAPPAVADETLGKRLARFAIANPLVQSNGAITGDGQTLYLYGLKRFDSRISVSGRRASVNVARRSHPIRCTSAKSCTRRTVYCARTAQVVSA